MALAYLIVMVLLGDLITRRWFTSDSFAQRLATAFLVGLLVATWMTYLASLLASGMDQPLVAGNAVFIGLVGSVLVLERLRAWRRKPRPADWRAHWMARIHPRAMRLWPWELGFLAGLTAIITWMAFATFSYGDGVLTVGGHELGDFGANTAIAAGFSIGHNFPTEYPLFAGERSLYHFLFYFQAGNLSFLGWDPALAGNLLFVGSMVSLLVVLMALARRVFGSTAVAVLSAALFFFHGSLSFIPYLATFDSIDAALQAVPTSGRFLSSIFPYRGEDWAFWTQNVFLNQRHLASAIGLLLVVFLFVVERAMPSVEAAPGSAPTRASNLSPVRDRFRRVSGAGRAAFGDPALPGYLVCGLILGLLPLWNGAIYLAAAVLMGSVLAALREPRADARHGSSRRVDLGPAAHLPPARRRPVDDSIRAFHWGFVVTDADPRQRRRVHRFPVRPKAPAHGGGCRCEHSASSGGSSVAICSFGVVAFTFQLSVDIANNHKILIVWLILGNLYVAFGLVVLWRWSTAFRGRALPALPRYLGRADRRRSGGNHRRGRGDRPDAGETRTSSVIRVGMQGDRLFDWVRDKTDRGTPSSDRRSTSSTASSLPAGGSTSAGRLLRGGRPADVTKRENWYRDLCLRTAVRVTSSSGLQAAGIDYVAFDDGLRGSVEGSTSRSTASISSWSLTTPTTSSATRRSTGCPTEPRSDSPCPVPRPRSIHGGTGSAPGRFDAPRGGRAPMVRSRWRTPATAGSRSSRPTGPGRSASGSRARTGQLDRPTGVAVDPTAYSMSRTGDRVQVYDGRTVDDEAADRARVLGPRDIASPGTVRCLSSTTAGAWSKIARTAAIDVRFARRRTGSAARTDGHRAVPVDPRGRHRKRRVVVFSETACRRYAVPEWAASRPDARGHLAARLRAAVDRGRDPRYDRDGHVGTLRNAETPRAPRPPNALVVPPQAPSLVTSSPRPVAVAGPELAPRHRPRAR